MKKFLKWAAVIFGLSAASFAALAFLVNSKKDACLKGEGRPAMEACGFLLDNYPASRRAEFHARRAALYDTAGRENESVADLKALVALKEQGFAPQPLLLSAYEALVKAYDRRGDQAERRKYMELAAAGGSRVQEIHVALAGQYAEEKRGEEALKLLETAAGLGKPGHPYYNALASAHEALNDYPKAYDDLKTGLTVNAPRPVLAETAKHLGLVCYELKRYQEAETYLAYALRAGAACPECGLLLTTIRGSLAPAPAPRQKKKLR